MRDRLIDVAKGLGIVLVVFAHIFEGTVTDLIYLFHMPLFFFLSGATFSFSKNRFSIIKRVKNLLIPYVFFSIVSFLYWWLIESHFRPVHDKPIFSGIMGEFSIPIQQFINIFVSICSGSAFIYNSPLWFLTCLFTSIVLYTLIKRYSGRYSLLLCCLCAVLYYSLEFLSPRLPLCFEIALPTLPLLWLGDWAYKKIEVASCSKDICMSIISLIICITVVFVFHPTVDMMEHDMGIWWQFYLCSVTMIVLLLLSGKMLLPFELGKLQWLGRNSLIIMCIHGPIYRIVLYAISFLVKQDVSVIRHSFFMSSCVVLLVVVIIIPIVLFINNYMPFVLGRKKANI